MSAPAHESAYEPRRSSVWPMFVAGIALSLIFFGATSIIRSWTPNETTVDEARDAERRTNLQTLKESNREALETYGWVDRDAGTVRIPIQRAMELEIAALNQRQPAPAYPVDPDLAAAPAPASEAPTAPVEEESAPVEPTAELEQPVGLTEEGEAPERHPDPVPEATVTEEQ